MRTVTDSMSYKELIAWESSPMYLVYTQCYNLWQQGYDIESLDYDCADFDFTPKELMDFEQDVFKHILPVDTTGLGYLDIIKIMDLPF